MKRKENAPTMKDVAREAGVALGTVSKVFNSIPVGEDYRRRVEEAARKLGYQVNSYARGASAYGLFGNCAVSVEAACREEFDGDAARLLAEFLDSCHYAA